LTGGALDDGLIAFASYTENLVLLKQMLFAPVLPLKWLQNYEKGFCGFEPSAH
jgi:hypothetical protein